MLDEHLRDNREGGCILDALAIVILYLLVMLSVAPMFYRIHKRLNRIEEHLQRTSDFKRMS